MNPERMTEADFGLDAASMPNFSAALVADVQAWLERGLTEAERSRLRDLCAK